ncbi:hypothetical protein R3W88_027467 [Solanum pinnatisectum]|uniref:Crooked neck protein n=1 Tax=Solanum pinnatisectum TaxID=50273 RepID=A0AAV9LH05_9SOLN|nr:hypothetical protein R3W88_027467 [Solanum pinnatisectum]
MSIWFVNLWDEAVIRLPRVDQLWYKYIHMEEMLGNVAGARGIFERWMPDQQGWLSYIKFELRYNEIERAREIFQRFVQCHPKVSAWIRFAKFEMKNGEDDDEEAEQLFVAFAEFEDKCRETDRGRCIYKFALDHIPKGRAEDLYNKFVAFEKQYGDREGIEDAIKNPRNYDTWFDYIRLEESIGNTERIREVYERAIANRYIYLWINYALYEELDAQDMERTRHFEIRQLRLKEAWLLLGEAIGRAPKDKIFNKYIEIELHLGNIDSCRKRYEKYLEWSPENCYAWSKFAELERSLYETERARAVFELAIDQPALDIPDLLWKAYIDFEISEGEFERTRALYERLLNRTKHLKVWISYAKFEASAIDDSDIKQKKKCLQHARDVFVSYLIKEERTILVEECIYMESNLGNTNLVRAKLPKKLKKRRQIETEDGPTAYEEYIDYLFPQANSLNILASAYKWKKQRIATKD